MEEHILGSEIRAIRAMGAISGALALTRSLPDFCLRVHEVLGSLMDFSSFSVAVRDGEKTRLRFPVILENGRTVTETVRDADALIRQVMASGQTRQGQTGAGVRVGVPLKLGDTVVGGMDVTLETAPGFSIPAGVGILEAAGGMVALAVEREREQDELSLNQRLTRTMFKISNAVNTTYNLEELYQSIHLTLGAVVDVSNFAIGIYDPHQDTMSYPYYVDETGDVYQEIRDVSRSAIIAADVIRLEQPVESSRQQTILRAENLGLPVVGSVAEQWLGVPLKIRETVIGVMVVQHYTDPEYYTQKDRDLLVAVSEQVALAIDRKRFQESLKDHKENLEMRVAERTRELTAEVRERIEVEKRLKKAKVAAEAGARAKIEFLTNMSHEIRTPLNGIMGMAELAMEYARGGELRETLSTIETEASHLLGIINEILDFSKIEAGKLAMEEIPFDLRHTFEQVCASLAVGANEKGLEFLFFLSPRAPIRLMGDPGRLRQVLVNLASNAIKFTEKGEILIRGELVRDLEETVELRFSVKDTGIGIAGEKQATIFDSFSQADGSTARKYGGTGLGTTISKQLVTLMGGNIGVESAEGKGSTFWFTARFRKQARSGSQARNGARARAGTEDAVGGAGLAGVKVLVLDDNRNSREIFEQYLTSFGCEPVLVRYPEEGAALLSQSQEAANPDIGGVIVHHGLTGSSGFDTVTFIRQVHPLIPVVLVAARGRRGHARACRHAGANGYLNKPFRRRDLRNILASVLGLDRERHAASERLVTRHTIAEERMKPVRILVAEDYPTNQKIIQKYLSGAGFQVCLAENGRQAVNRFKSCQFDLVLMDIQMPEMDGYEATAMIRAHENRLADSGDGGARRTPVIAITAHAIKGYREKCLAAGMDDYLTKPVQRNGVLEMVERWIGKEARPENRDDAGASPVASHGVFDPDRALAEFEGDEGFLTEVLTEFLQTLDRQIEGMTAALEAGNAGDLAREAHAVKGGAANLTAARLSETAHDLEKMGRSGDLTGGFQGLSRLEAERDRLKKQVGGLAF